MANRFFTKTIILLIGLGLLFTICTVPTSASALSNHETQVKIPDFQSFVNSLENGQEGVLRGLYVKNTMALRIAQQPIGDDNFITPVQGYVTEFRMAANQGTIGLLAHNYLAGQSFFQLAPEQEIYLIYGNKETKVFVVTDIQSYQTLSPASPTSDFISLDSGKRFTASSLFSKIYSNGSGNLILQTCIFADQNMYWGRLFVIAKPIT